MESREIDMIMYESSCCDSLICSRRGVKSEYKDKMDEISCSGNAKIELIRTYEKERIDALYKAWHSIYRYVLALGEVLENEHLSDVANEFFEGIKSEVQDEYLKVSDDWKEMHSGEKIVEKHTKGGR